MWFSESFSVLRNIIALELVTLILTLMFSCAGEFYSMLRVLECGFGPFDDSVTFDTQFVALFFKAISDQWPSVPPPVYIPLSHR